MCNRHMHAHYADIFTSTDQVHPMFSFLKKKSPEPEKDQPAKDKFNSSWIRKLKSELARTGGQLADLFSRNARIDDDLYEELETILITADVGLDATNALLADLRHQVKEQHLSEAVQLREALAHCLLSCSSRSHSRCNPSYPSLLSSCWWV